MNVAPNGFFVDPAKGLDTNAGDQAAPFQTIQKAAQSLTADGQSIYLAPGTYDGATQKTMSFTFARVTNVRGLGPGVVLKQVTAGVQMFVFNAGGEARDVAIQGSAGGIQATAGTFAARGTSFDGCATAFSFLGSAVATIDESGVATPVTNPANGGLATVLVADVGSNVTLEGGGGSFTGVAAQYVSAVLARGHTTLTVKDFTVSSVASHALVLFDNAHVALENVTIDKSGLGTSSGTDRAVILMGGQNTEVPMTPSLAITGGGITNGTGPGIALSLYGSTAETPSITLTSTHVDGNALAGVIASGSITNASLTVTITAKDTTFDGNTGPGIATPRATLSITGGSFKDDTSDGVQINDPKSTSSLAVRGATFDGNGGYGVAFAGVAGSTLDLGTAASPGGLTFLNVNAKFAAVDLEAPIAGTAIGDTWVPNGQGADAAGKYTTPTTLTTSGINAKLGAGASLVVE